MKIFQFIDQSIDFSKSQFKHNYYLIVSLIAKKYKMICYSIYQFFFRQFVLFIFLILIFQFSTLSF